MAVDERVAGLARRRAELIPGHVVEITRGVQVSLAVEPAGFDLRVQADAWNDKPDRRQVGRTRRCRLQLIATIGGRGSRDRAALRLHRRRCDHQHGLISKRRKHQAEAENQDAPRHAGGILDGRTRLRALYDVGLLTVVRTGRRLCPCPACSQPPVVHRFRPRARASRPAHNRRHGSARVRGPHPRPRP